MVALLLVTLAAGAFDYGMGWRTGLAVTEAARSGARVGSSQGPNLNADFSLLSSVKAALASSNQIGKVDRVVIYRSATADGSVPANCKTTTNATIPEDCNILKGTQLQSLPASVTGATDANGCIVASQTKGWCPAERQDVQVQADYIGIWIRVRYDFQFRMLRSSTFVERSAVMRIEPKER